MPNAARSLRPDALVVVAARTLAASFSRVWSGLSVISPNVPAAWTASWLATSRATGEHGVAPRDGASEFVIKMREPREGGGQRQNGERARTRIRSTRIFVGWAAEAREKAKEREEKKAS